MDVDRPGVAPEVIGALAAFGFNKIEAEVYSELLRHPGSTGYVIGKVLRRPHSNVYKALEALESRGAVLYEPGSPRTYAAVPPLELLGQLQRQFNRDCDAAASVLTSLEARKAPEDRFYRLTTADQLFERAEAMISEAKETILFQGHPMPATRMRRSLVNAHSRGVAVAGVVFRPEDQIPGTRIIVSQIADWILYRYPADLFNLVTDGKQFLMGLLDSTSGGVRNAVWGDSAFVSSTLHNALVSDVILHDQDFIREIESPNVYLFGRFSPGSREVVDGST